MKTPKTLNTDECFLLASHMLQGYSKPHKKTKVIRNFTMMILMLDAGLRVSEVSKLLVSDLIFQDEPVHSLMLTREICKRHRARVIPLTDRLRQNIGEMKELIWFPNGKCQNPFAFTIPRRSTPLTVRQIQRIIQRAALDSIGRSIHPHILRHTFASRLMRKTSIRVIQELLGHKNLSSTQIYTHPNGDDLQNAIKSL